MSAHLAVILLALVLEHKHFVCAGLLYDLCCDSCADDVRISEACLCSFSSDGDYLVEDDLCENFLLTLNMAARKRSKPNSCENVYAIVQL